MKLYRQVKPEERLPKKGGWYFVGVKDPELVHDIDIMHWHQYPDYFNSAEDWYREEEQQNLWINSFEYWLEEIEITEEKITDIIYDNVEWNDNDHIPIINGEKSAKAIIKLLEE
jgi:hypothetical protein